MREVCTPLGLVPRDFANHEYLSELQNANNETVVVILEAELERRK